MSFREIEYKYLVDRDFDPEALRRKMSILGPERTTAVKVRDVYYLLTGMPGHICRHRYDEELQQLTLKSLGDDAFDRLEVNLELGHHRGDQTARVEAFLEPFGIRWQGTIEKEIEVYEFADCEIVYYVARADGHEVRCVEFEARGTDDVDQAREILARYLKPAGFGGAQRETKSLVRILFPERFES